MLVDLKIFDLYMSPFLTSLPKWVFNNHKFDKESKQIQQTVTPSRGILVCPVTPVRAHSLKPLPHE